MRDLKIQSPAMDPATAAWVLDFLLRQSSITDDSLKYLTSSLSLPSDNLNLNKAILLRRIETEIAKGTVSENILALLELVHVLDRKAGVPATEAMKQAYCLTAVECTVQAAGDAAEYFETVKRVWRERLEEMREVELVTEELVGWRDVFVAGVWNSKAGERLREFWREGDALAAVSGYVKGAWEGLGLSFIEVVASEGAAMEILGLLEREGEGEGEGEASFRAREIREEEVVCNGNDYEAIIDDEMREVLPSADNQALDQTPAINNVTLTDDTREVESRVRNPASTAPKIKQEEIIDNGNNTIMTDDAASGMLCSGDNEVLLQISVLNSVHDVMSPRGTHQPRCKHVARKRSTKVVAGTSRGAKITDTEQVSQDVLNRYGSLPSPAIVKIQKALRNSAVELQAVVDDPLPEALELAENVISSKIIDISNPEVPENISDLERPCTCHQISAPKPSLMTRNSPAHTYEWDDSVDNLPEGDGESRSKFNLPTPKNMAVSPLKKHEIENLRVRRKKKWTLLEEETLRTGVDKYGRGNWKTILTARPDVFDERTYVDLKDKWRNMTRNFN